jgi:UDP-GlcNAc:undecaprenyl-phosphate GlcNAc-1-phosphate transferase
MTLAIQVATAFLVTLLLTPACRMACLHFGWVDHPDMRKLHRAPVPRAGGIAIFLGYAAALHTSHAWTMLPAVAVAFGTGLLDDLVNVKPRTKIAGQVLAALLACAAGVQILGPGAWWHIPLTVVWLVGCTNAVNLIDGLDGLAAGVGLFAAAAAFLAALLTGNTAIAVLTAPLLGALLAFLIYNFYPASIFMGDCGSNTVGFLLGLFAIMWTQMSTAPAAAAAPVVALAVPILDTALAIFRRFVRRGPIFAADRGHIHHRLLSRGFSVRRVACILYIAAGIFACLSVLLITGAYAVGPVLLAVAILVWLALRYLRYDEFVSLRRVLFGGTLRHVLAADLAVRQLEAALHSASSVDECWLPLQLSGQSLGLARATMRVHGRTFTAQFQELPHECWSVTVPLADAGTIELEIPAAPAPGSVSRLATVLQTTLAARLQALRPQLAYAATAGWRR